MGLEPNDLPNTETSRDSNSDGGPRKRPTPSATDHPVVIGEYRVQVPLGRGGQGAVYSALDPKLRRIVALKLMHGGSEEQNQLLNEAQNGAKVIHPNVVTIFSVETVNQQRFITMEFLPRGSLRAWISEEARPVSHIVARFVEAARGLSAIHAAGLVHRDFKPDNVLLKENGSAAVADFGLSRAKDDDAASRSGTSHFMAPELRAHGAATTSTDQYAFCVSLYWALARTYPPEGRDVYFPPPVPAWLRKILERGLQRHPGDRYPSMDALIADLENTPEVRRRALLRTLALVTGLGALAAAALVLALNETPQQRALRECTERVSSTRDTLWSPRLKENISKNFTVLAGSEGTQTFERVRQRVDPQVDAWARASVAACQIKEPVARRNTESCLQERRAVLSALTDYLSTTRDPDTVRDVIRTLSKEMKPVDSCAQATLVATDREETESERLVRSSLAPVLVLRAAGRWGDALEAVQKILPRAEQFPRVNAEATLLEGQLLADLGEGEAADRLTVGIDLAESVGADELRARGWIALVSFYARRMQLAKADEAEQHATAIVERLGRPSLLMAPLLNARGTLEFERRDIPRSHEHFLELQTLLLASYEAGDPATFHARNNVLLTGPVGEQVKGFEALLLETERALGEKHQETLFTRRNLAGALLRTEQCSLAEAQITDVITTRLSGGPHLQSWSSLAADYSVRARARRCLSRLDEAIADQREAVALMSKSSDQKRADAMLGFYELLKLARRPQIELDNILFQRCNLGFGRPDGVECPANK